MGLLSESWPVELPAWAIPPGVRNGSLAPSLVSHYPACPMSWLKSFGGPRSLCPGLPIVHSSHPAGRCPGSGLIRSLRAMFTRPGFPLSSWETSPCWLTLVYQEGPGQRLGQVVAWDQCVCSWTGPEVEWEPGGAPGEWGHPELFWWPWAAGGGAGRCRCACFIWCCPQS